MGRLDSRAKGARGEREAAKVMRSLGLECVRSAQVGKTAPDMLHNLYGWHIEVKYGSRPFPSKALEQAKADRPDLYPLALTRQVSKVSGAHDWLITIRAADLCHLAEVYLRNRTRPKGLA